MEHGIVKAGSSRVEREERRGQILEASCLNWSHLKFHNFKVKTAPMLAPMKLACLNRSNYVTVMQTCSPKDRVVGTPKLVKIHSKGQKKCVKQGPFFLKQNPELK